MKRIITSYLIASTLTMVGEEPARSVGGRLDRTFSKDGVVTTDFD